MARRNRVSVPDGTYHVTSRIVNREMWLGDPKLKDEIVSWIYGVAAFSGVELLAWAVLDNHFHLVVHVPVPPRELWCDPGEQPDTHAFGMRPPENRPPLWRPASVDGDGPATERPGAPAGGDSPLLVRPTTGFMLSDEQMLERLARLYGDSGRVEALRRSWAAMRRAGNGGAVDAIKEGYCRRMYNLSQFVKTLKERIAQAVNRRRGHVGHVFEGRFYSGLLEDDGEVRRLVSLYVDYNPYKARIVREDEDYAWSSFGQARGNGLHAVSCRAAYERIHGCVWEEARERIEAAFRERVADEREFGRMLDEGKVRATQDQLIHLHVPALSRGPFIGRGTAFGRRVVAGMTRNFPRPSFRSLRWLARAVAWSDRRHVT